MEQDQAPPPAPIDFDRADMPVAAASTCAAGQHPLSATYYAINGRAICQACRDRFEQERGTRGSFGAALVLGVGAATIGAAIYYGIFAATDSEWGLIAIIVGVLVGKAVRRGAGARTGWHYRCLALALTYFAITATYVPLVLKGGMHSVVLACFVAVILPGIMLAHLDNLLGLVILGIGLYEAYKLSAPPRLVVEGPFTQPAQTPAIAAAAAAPPV